MSKNPFDFSNSKPGDADIDWRYTAKMVLSLIGCVMLGALMATVMPTNELSMAVIVGMIIGLILGRMTARWELWHLVRKVEDRVDELVRAGQIKPSQINLPNQPRPTPKPAPQGNKKK